MYKLVEQGSESNTRLDFHFCNQVFVVGWVEAGVAGSWFFTTNFSGHGNNPRDFETKGLTIRMLQAAFEVNALDRMKRKMVEVDRHQKAKALV